MSTHNPYAPPGVAPERDAPGGDGGTGVPGTVVSLLAQTRPWVKLLSILTFVGMGLGVVMFVVMLTLGPAMGKPQTTWTLLPMVLMMLIYLPAALFLWRYAVSIRSLQQGGGTRALEAALGSQKSFWKYVGILAVVMIGVYVVIIVVAIGSGMFAAFNRQGS